MTDRLHEPHDEGYQEDLKRRIDSDDPSLIPDSVSMDEHLQKLQEIEKGRTAREQLKHRAELDDLTQWYRRRAGLERVEELITRHKPAAIAAFLLDIHEFKSVNDTYGHAVGDTVLVNFVQRIGANLDSDDIKIRLGGEEFVIFSLISAGTLVQL